MKNIKYIYCLSLISFLLLGFSCSKGVSSKMRAEITYSQDESMEKNTENLTLFINPNCPFCAKVTNFLEKHNISIVTKDTQEDSNKQFLIRHGGKKQVPCLFIDDLALYESNDIIKYISEIQAIDQ